MNPIDNALRESLKALLCTRQPLGPPMVGHSAAVVAVDCATVDGVPLALTASNDNTVGIWDLRTRSRIAALPFDRPRCVAAAPTGDIVVGFQNDVTLLRRKPHS